MKQPTLGITKYPDCNTTARERIGIVFAAFHNSLRDLHRMRGFTNSFSNQPFTLRRT